MPLTGHDSPVVDHPDHESKSHLLGPHGSRSYRDFASDRNARLAPYRGMEVTTGVGDGESDISSTDDRSEEGDFFKTAPSASYRIHSFLPQLNSRSSKTLLVSSPVATVLLRSSPLPSSRPRLFLVKLSPFTIPPVAIINCVLL